MKYVTLVNELFRLHLKGYDNFVLYGQNISTGSCLGGLSRNFDSLKNCSVLNTTNTENCLVGMGFGLMLNGTSSAFFMKQQDFLLLGIDHLRNTNNYTRQLHLKNSFTIVSITMDAGYEGMQSSLNNISDFCAISDCEGYTISTKQEAVHVISQNFTRPGFRIICVSQRLLNSEILDLNSHKVNSKGTVIKYFQGLHITIACFNFSIPQGHALSKELNLSGIMASLFNVIAGHLSNYSSIIDDAKKTGRLLILDDSKSIMSTSNFLEAEAVKSGIKYVRLIKRGLSEKSYRPSDEIFSVDTQDIIQHIRL